MDFGLVRKILGNILKIEAALMAVPFTVSLLWREPAAIAFVWSIAITAAAGILLGLGRVEIKEIKTREALMLVTLAWVAVSAFAALPYLLSGAIAEPTEAFFEAVSGLTTTGATVIDNVEILPRGILFWRSLTSWFGGMGILLLTLTVLPSLGVVGFQMYKAELPGPTTDKLAPRLVDTVKILYLVYGGMTLVQTIMLTAGGLSLFDALLLTFATVSTGGFSPYNTSIAPFSANSYVIIIISVWMILSGVNFGLYYDLWRGRWRRVIQNSELRLYLALVTIGVFAVAWNLCSSLAYSWFEGVKHALVQVSSIVTTTGYTSVDYNQWPAFSKLVLFLLMFTGACAGSTTGAIKLIRLIIAGKLVKREVAHLLHSRAMVPITVNGYVVPEETIRSVCAFLFLYLALFAAGTVILSAEGISMATSASAVAAALGNVGPGFGAVGPAHTYSQFSPWATMLLTALMLLGRLELFTMIAVITPGYWKQ